MSERISILCSGVALGVYVPGLLLGESIARNGGDYDAFVLESLFSEDKLEMVLRNKKAFHASFRVALTGQKIPNNIGSSIDEKKKSLLFRRWQEEGRHKFIVFTGFWLNLLEEYLALAGITREKAQITIFHMDAELSVSWRAAKEKLMEYPNVWIFSGEENKINGRIAVEDDCVVPFYERGERYVIHGGGWGMGTYRGQMSTIHEHNLPMDLILYDDDEYMENEPQIRQYLLDPSWRPWETDSQGRLQFPRFARVLDKDRLEYFSQSNHGIFHLIKNSRAIISKPGGGTLLDSFAAATPVIFLESFGKYEDENSRLWQELGYGITLEHFINQGCRMQLLKEMHDRIMHDRSTAIEYGRLYAAKDK